MYVAVELASTLGSITSDLSLKSDSYCICYKLHKEYSIIVIRVHTFSITDTLAIIIIIIVDTTTCTTIIIHSTTLTVTRWTLVVLQHSVD